MISPSRTISSLLPVALVFLSAAVFVAAQETSGHKQNTRPEIQSTVAPSSTSKAAAASYTYEFTQPEFLIRRILIEHDAEGHGRISFEKKNEETPINEEIELSPPALARISGLWESLHFLESTEDYQSNRQYPHLGTMRLKMEQGARSRTAEFNWTNQKDAAALADEYRHLADQAILVFDISVARESQPLNAPKLMDQLETMLKRKTLSDANQLLPLLKEISTDEHVPLIARNHALRLIKTIEK